MTFARSIDMVVPMDVTITRVALTNADDVDRGSAGDTEAAAGQMGRKSLVPYGLYRQYGFVNPYFGETTGITTEDLQLFWEALQNMWDMDHSAARGLMGCRGLYVFSHNSKLGNASAHTLFELITPELKDKIVTPRKFNDYSIKVNEAKIPAGVTLSSLIG